MASEQQQHRPREDVGIEKVMIAFPDALDAFAHRMICRKLPFQIPVTLQQPQAEDQEVVPMQQQPLSYPGPAGAPVTGFATSAVPLPGGGYVATAEGPGYVAVAQGVSGTGYDVATGVAAVTDALGNTTYYTTSMQPTGKK